MIDIELLRTNSELVRRSEKKRNRTTNAVDSAIELDNKWKSLLKEEEVLRKERNDASASFSKSNSAEKTALRNKVNKINVKVKELEDERKAVETKRNEALYRIGNILDPSVPPGTEEDKIVLRTVGKTTKKKGIPHAELVESWGLANTEKAGEVSGSRFFYMKGDLIRLSLGLQRFAIETLEKRGFIPLYTPFLLGEEQMKAASELADLEAQLYHIPKDGLYLIATSEQTLAAYHWKEIIEPENLPKKYAGISTCFRREAGAHGKDTKGIFRVHQFEKIEQFVFCLPEDSQNFHLEMVENSEIIMKALELPYRVVNISAGELNDNASLKYDIEAWFPAQQEYRELVSASNCTDYQSRKLQIRTRGKDGRTIFVHSLNATAIAIQRTICAILENHQDGDSVAIPKALHQFVGKKEILREKQ